MNLRKFIFTLFALTLLFPIASNSAELYKWVDDSGNVHYGDNPPEKADLRQITGAITSFETVEVEAFKFDSSLVTSSNKSGTKSVIMYSTSWCGYCKKARKHFISKNIPFKEYDIEKSEKAAIEYKKLNGRGVPVILIGKKRMNGFSAGSFDRIYYEKT